MRFTALLSLFLVHAARAADISSLEEVPQQNVNINLASQALGEDQAPRQATVRLFSSNNRKALSQTFVWNSPESLKSIGLLITSLQNAEGSGMYFSNSQEFFIDLQRLDRTGTVEETLASERFHLTKDDALPGRYLEIIFREPVPLVEGESYGFVLRPASSMDNQALGIAVSAEKYLEGFANHRDDVSAIANGSAYEKGSFDLAFFTTTSGGH